jgi:hypothetical protein
MSLIGAYTALSSTGAPGLAIWNDISYLRSYTEDFTERHPGGLTGETYGTFSHTTSSGAAFSVSDTASFSATEDPVDRNEIATGDTARLSASDVSQLFQRIDVTDTATLTAGETIALLQSGVILKTASDTASLSATEVTALGVTVDVSDTASLSATDISTVDVSAQNLSVTETASLSADDEQFLEIFAGIVDKTVFDSVPLTGSDIATVSEIGRVRKISFHTRMPRITFEVI